MKWIGIIPLVWALFCLSPAFAAPTSAQVPLDSWIYPALDKLEGLGLVESSLQGTRPFTRLEAARQVGEARTKADAGEASPLVRQLLSRLEKELHDPLVELGELEGAVPPSYFRPLRTLELTYILQDGELSATPGTNARQFALDYNNFGIDYANHNNVQATFASEARLASFFLLEARPILLAREGEDPDLRLLEGRAALGLGPIEVSFGRQALWWGQGRHGSLLLTNNAQPLDMLRITNPTPGILPWFFKYLGPCRFDLFWSRLEEDRTVPEPYLAGLRLTAKPFSFLELGASRTVIFGGEGQPGIDLGEFVFILGGENVIGEGDTSNQLAAVDARLKLPFLWGAELYYELGGEDEAGGFLAKKSQLYGLYLPRIEPTGRTSLRLEYADVNDSHSVWYRHGLYSSGYTYKGKILGHHVGGEATDLFSELRLILPRDLTLSLSLDIEKRGYNQAAREDHLQPALGVEWQLQPNLTLDVRYAYDRVENFNFVSGNDREFYLGELSLVRYW